MATRKPKGPEASPQQALAPAPVAPNENDEARAAIATINTQLAEIDREEAGLAHLEKSYANVAYPVATPKGMKDACEARLAIRKPRFAVENARKAAKAPVLDLGRKIDARASAITTRLMAIETPIDDQIAAQEQIEKDRVAALQRRLAEIEATPDKAIGQDVEGLEQIIDGLNTVALESFAEFKERAAAAQTQATVKVTHLLVSARQAAESARLQKQLDDEEHRKAGIRRQIASITGYEETAKMARNSERLQGLITKVEAIVIDESYQEFAASAREEKTRVLVKLRELLATKTDEETARATAAAAPAPTPAPTHAPSPVPTSAPAPTYRPLDTEVNEDMRNLPRGDYAPREAAQREADPFSAPAPAPRPVVEAFDDVVDAEITTPTDAEILAVVAAHYDVPLTVAAKWLDTFDSHAALAQQSLIA